jgi:hypothetical protein
MGWGNVKTFFQGLVEIDPDGAVAAALNRYAACFSSGGDIRSPQEFFQQAVAHVLGS